MVPSPEVELSSFLTFEGADEEDADTGLLVETFELEEVESKDPPMAVAIRSAEGVGKGIVCPAPVERGERMLWKSLWGMNVLSRDPARSSTWILCQTRTRIRRER